MTDRESIRRRALEDRVRLAEQDIADLQQQVDDGEIDEETAASLEERYRSDLDDARTGLAGMPKPVKAPQGAKAKPAPASSARASIGRTPLIIGAAVAAMVLLTVIIVVLATGGDDAPNPTAASYDDNTAQLAAAQGFFEAGDYMNAMNSYSGVTAGNPSPGDAAIANARIGWMAWVALNDPVTALSFLDASIALDPGYGEAVLWKGVVLLYGMEDGARAAPLLEQVLLFPDLPEELRPDVELMLEEARGGSQ